MWPTACGTAIAARKDTMCQHTMPGRRSLQTAQGAAARLRPCTRTGGYGRVRMNDARV